ncbi:uncharacterized protein JCM15063_002208 [Sporobolomyces koalae]|uniref:uncharacterized protein n=1 Tax=Sporobolomyces koalae TaxID=500713 RepID=UPI00317EDF1B
MVLQNKHKQLASKQYKKAHGIPSTSRPTATTSSTAAVKETHQERQLRLGSNQDRYIESDDEDAEGTAQDDEDEIDEELLAHQQSEREDLERFLAKQQEQLVSDRAADDADPDDNDVDSSFAHLRIRDKNKKGKAIVRGATDDPDLKLLEGEARRAQAIRDLKDRFSTSSSTPVPSATNKKLSSRLPPPAVRKPPPLPGMSATPANRGGEDFLDSLL